MTTEELLKLHEELTAQARELMRRKNHDYSGTTKTFANFERVAAMDICSVEQGFFVRLCDKFSRLITLTAEGKTMVKDESVRDTIIDMINYPILYLAWMEEQKEKKLTQQIMPDRSIEAPSFVPTHQCPNCGVTMLETKSKSKMPESCGVCGKYHTSNDQPCE